MSTQAKTRLRVFVTKTGKFRAQFERRVPKPSVFQPAHTEKVKGECTIGGRAWAEAIENGPVADPALTPELRERVRVKCRTIIDTLEAEYQAAFEEVTT